MPPGRFTTVDADGGVKIQERDPELGGVAIVIAHFEKSLLSIGIFWQLVHFYNLLNASV